MRRPITLYLFRAFLLLLAVVALGCWVLGPHDVAFAVTVALGLFILWSKG
jgi:hypothetical protein